jgi:hypothetical protein
MADEHRTDFETVSSYVAQNCTTIAEDYADSALLPFQNQREGRHLRFQSVRVQFI